MAQDLFEELEVEKIPQRYIHKCRDQRDISTSTAYHQINESSIDMVPPFMLRDKIRRKDSIIEVNCWPSFKNIPSVL